MDRRRGSSPIVPNAKTDACASPPPAVTAPVEPWQKGNWRGFERVVHRGLMNKSRHGTIMRDLHPSHLIHSLTTCSDVVLASRLNKVWYGKTKPEFPKKKNKPIFDSIDLRITNILKKIWGSENQVRKTKVIGKTPCVASCQVEREYVCKGKLREKGSFSWLLSVSHTRLGRGAHDWGETLTTLVIPRYPS